jgi:hypothetical protein
MYCQLYNNINVPINKFHNRMSHTITEAPKYFTMVKEANLSLLQNILTISGPTQPTILEVLVFFHWAKAAMVVTYNGLIFTDKVVRSHPSH